MEKKPRIALAITLAEQGGAQTFLLTFATWLKQQGYDVTLLAGDGNWLLDEATVRGIRTIKLVHMGRAIHPIRDMRSLIELARVLKTLKPDAIHLNSTKMGVVGSIAGKLAHIPRIVYRIGGWVFLEPLSPITKWLYIKLEQWTARFKNVIIVLHPGDEKTAIERGIKPIETLVTVPNGLNLLESDLLIREEARHELHLPQEAFIFGTVANFYPVKNMVAYIDACAEIIKTHSNVHFVFAGEGPLEKTVREKVATLGLETHIHLVGTLENNAKLFLRAFDVFVLPSLKEGMSWALLEAMWVGIPCIATNVGANTWMSEIGRNAIDIVPANDLHALVHTMKESVINIEQKRDRAEQSKHFIQEAFRFGRTMQGNLSPLLSQE